MKEDCKTYDLYSIMLTNVVCDKVERIFKAKGINANRLSSFLKKNLALSNENDKFGILAGRNTITTHQKGGGCDKQNRLRRIDIKMFK
jgi:hypothetical protein